MKEIEELLSEIDEKEIESVSKPRRELIRFIKEIFLNVKGGTKHA